MRDIYYAFQRRLFCRKRSPKRPVSAKATRVLHRESETEIWTFAGGHSNQFLAACLPAFGIPVKSTNGLRLTLDAQVSTNVVLDAISEVATGQVIPPFDRDHPMLRGLKFSELLPPELLEKAARARLHGDVPHEPFGARCTVVTTQE